MCDNVAKSLRALIGIQVCLVYLTLLAYRDTRKQDPSYNRTRLASLVLGFWLTALYMAHTILMSSLNYGLINAYGGGRSLVVHIAEGWDTLMLADTISSVTIVLMVATGNSILVRHFCFRPRFMM